MGQLGGYKSKNTRVVSFVAKRLGIARILKKVERERGDTQYIHTSTHTPTQTSTYGRGRRKHISNCNTTTPKGERARQ